VTLPNGRYTAELPASATTPGLAQTHTFEFHKQAGDVNGNGAVSNSDYTEVNAHFGMVTGGNYRPGDANGNGVVSNSDYTAVNANFGTVLAALQFDFGDAPDSATFPTTLANNGARHVITGNSLRLGATRDAETNGQSSADASGDGADEDGLVIGDLERGTSVDVTVTANVPSSAVSNGGVDFNQDGDWDDLGEQVFTDRTSASPPTAKSKTTSSKSPNVCWNLSRLGWSARAR
jgi:hypothetical protein